MTNILIPIDFSEASWDLTRCALSIYAKTGIRFYLLHTEKIPPSFTETRTEVTNRKRDFQERLLQLQPLLSGGQEIIPLSWKGSTVENIREAVFQYDINLIILNTNYSDNLDVNVGGSYFKDVIIRIKCPVLLVPQGYHCTSPSQMVLLSDFNHGHRARATNTLVAFVTDMQAHLNILQLGKTSNALTEAQSLNKSLLQSNIESLSHSFHFVIHKTIDEALQFFVKINNVELIILFAKHISLAENILFSNKKNKHIDYHLKIPFLIIHE